MTEHRPSLRRRLFGTALRDYRTRAGLSLDDAAEVLGCHRSKISRIESGVRGCRPGEVVALLEEYDACHAERAALEALDRPAAERVALVALARPAAVPGAGEALPADSRDYLSLEAMASEIRSYGALQIPEIIQTPGYAAAVLEARPDVKVSEREHLAAAVVARRDALRDRGSCPVTVIVSEIALRQQVGGPAVMREQISELIQAGDNGSPVTVRVLPDTRAAVAFTAASSVTVLRLAGGLYSIAQLGSLQDGLYIDDQAGAGQYATALTQLEHAALPAPESALFLRQHAGSA